MKNERIISHILMSFNKSSISLSLLESQYNNIKKKLDKENIVKLSIKELQVLLAYEHWKDGAEPDYVSQIWKGKDSQAKNKVDLLKGLTIFGY